MRGPEGNDYPEEGMEPPREADLSRLFPPEGDAHDNQMRRNIDLPDDPEEGQIPQRSGVRRLFGGIRARFGQRSDGGMDNIPQDHPLDAPEKSREVTRTEVKRLVREAAEHVVTALSDEPSSVQKYALGYLAEALVQTEGAESAHEYATHAIETLDIPHEDAFLVWTELYKAGDEDALREAHRCIALEGKYLPLSYSESAVSLVEAGDTSMIPIAQTAILFTPFVSRAELFGRLYCAGDTQSLDLSINAAREASLDTELDSTRALYSRSDRALVSMAHSAIEKEDVADAVKIIDAVESDVERAIAHSALYKKGHATSLQPVLDYLSTATYGTETIERTLAEAGYAPARALVQKRVDAYGKKGSSYSIDPFEDFVSLYRSGDLSISAKLSDIVHASKNPGFMLHHLERVGLVEEAERLAEQLYADDPSPLHAEELIRFRKDTQAWEKIFRYKITERKDPQEAASYVSILASWIKSLEK